MSNNNNNEKSRLYPDMSPSYDSVPAINPSSSSVNTLNTTAPTATTIPTYQTTSVVTPILPIQEIGTPVNVGFGKYLGPNSQFEQYYNIRNEDDVQIDFDATFPPLMASTLEDGSSAVNKLRRLNSTIFRLSSDFIHIFFTFLVGLPISFLVGIFMGMTRTFYTYMAAPLAKWAAIMIRMMAPTWKAFFRSALDPMFESVSLALANVQVRIGMEANARHKAIKP